MVKSAKGHVSLFESYVKLGVDDKAKTESFIPARVHDSTTSQAPKRAYGSGGSQVPKRHISSLASSRAKLSRTAERRKKEAVLIPKLKQKNAAANNDQYEDQFLESIYRLQAFRAVVSKYKEAEFVDVDEEVAPGKTKRRKKYLGSLRGTLNFRRRRGGAFNKLAKLFRL